MRAKRTGALVLVAVAVGALAAATSCGGGGGGGGPSGSPVFVPNFLANDVRVDQPLPASVGDAFRPAICCEGDTVYVAFEDERNGNPDILFNASTDNGQTWRTADVRLDLGDAPGAEDSVRPVICCDGLRVYVAWIERRAFQGNYYFNRSLDGGLTWLPSRVQLDTNNTGPVSISGLGICCEGDDVFVTWSDDGTGDNVVYVAHSSDAGATWGAPQQINEAAGVNARGPSICCDVVGANLHVYVGWVDDRLGATQAFFNRSLDGGATWLASDVQLSAAGAFFVADVCCDGADLYVGWVGGGVGNPRPYFDASANSGTAWLGAKSLKSGPGNWATDLSLCCEGSSLYAVFIDNRDGEPDVYFNRSLDGGVTLLGGGEVRLDTGSVAGANATWAPRICCDGSDLAVVYADERSGHWDIWMTASTNQGTAWGLEQRLDLAGGTANLWEQPSMCCSGQRMYAIWADDRDQVDLQRVQINRTIDGGSSWLINDVRVSQPLPAGQNGTSSSQQICLVGTTAHAVWEDDRFGAYRILYNRSGDGGVTWMSTDVVLSTGAVDEDEDRDPVLCCDGNRVYVAWERRNGGFGGTEDIYFNGSSDGGVTWLPAAERLNVGVPAMTVVSGNPAICCEGANVYVAWRDDRSGSSDIYLNRSSDGGATWLGADVRLDVGDPPGVSFSGSVAMCCEGGRVYAVWNDGRNGDPDIYLNRSTDGGVTWLGADVRLDVGDAPGAARSIRPVICCEGTNVYVAWEDERDGDEDIYFNRSLDEGATWLAADVRLDVGDAAGASASEQAELCCDGGRVYVVWEDRRSGEEDVYFNRSLDDGTTWLAADVRLDTGDAAGADESDDQVICCAGEAVYVAWEDRRAADPGLYFNASLDGGTTWMAADVRISTTSTNRALSPEIACDGGRILVVWYQDDLSPGDIRANVSAP